MGELRRNFLVGLFVLGGAAALIAIIVLFGRMPAWVGAGATYPIHVLFPKAPGLREGTLVTVHGKEIGRVTGIEFVDPTRFGGGVRVSLAIGRQYELHQGSRAQTIEPGFGQGRPPIEIIPGPLDQPRLLAGAQLEGLSATAMESMIPPETVDTINRMASQIADAAKSLTPVLDDLHLMLVQRTPDEVDQPGGPTGNLSSAAVRLDATLKHFNTVLGDPAIHSHLRTTLENASAMSADGKLAMADIRAAANDAKLAATELNLLLVKGQDTLVKLDDEVGRVGRATVDGLHKAGGVLDSMQETTALLNRGDGTLGKLLRDDRLYEASVLTFRRLAEMVEEFTALAKEWRQGKVRIAL